MNGPPRILFHIFSRLAILHSDTIHTAQLIDIDRSIAIIMPSYQVPSKFLREFSPKEIHQLKQSFKSFDVDGNGSIEQKELAQVFQQLHEPHTEPQLTTMLSRVSLNDRSIIEFPEFLTILSRIRKHEGLEETTGAVRSPAPAPPIVDESRRPPPPASQPEAPSPEPPASQISPIQTTRHSFSYQPPAPGASYVPKNNAGSSFSPSQSRASYSYQPPSGTTSFLPKAPPSASSLNPPRASFSAGSPNPRDSAAKSSLQLHEVKGSSGGIHSYSEAEKHAFTEHINNCLANDPDVGPLLPVEHLFTSVSNGILLCKLINQAVSDTIDFRAVNVVTHGRKLNIYQKTENQNLVINAAKAIGCKVVNIGPQDLIEGKPILTLGLVWQIVKIQLTATINLKHHPELVRLLRDGESLEEFMNLPPDQILLRWMNYHLQAAKYPTLVSNFGGDVKDARAYASLLVQIAPQTCVNSPSLSSLSDHQRAQHVILQAQKLKVETFLKPEDITSGNTKLNMSFVAQLFNQCPALDVLEADLAVVADVLDDEDLGDTREERVFRMWINSLGIDQVYIHNLFNDLRDGLVLLLIFDRMSKKLVHWPKVNRDPKNKFKRVENCNYCVVLGKQLKFSLVNIGGVDVVEGNKKLILALIWQMLRYYQLQLLSSLSGSGSSRQLSDVDILEWANAKVGKSSDAVQSFRDPKFSDSTFLLALVTAIEPRSVNPSMIALGRTMAEKEQNAKYVLSVARKIGAAVFLTYEDIVEVKPKMIMTFVAALMSVDQTKPTNGG